MMFQPCFLAVVMTVRRMAKFSAPLRRSEAPGDLLAQLHRPKIALGRKNYLFMGSASGGKAAAIAYTLIETARLNGIDPQAWLAQVLEHIPDYKINRVDELLPWNIAPAADPEADR